MRDEESLVAGLIESAVPGSRMRYLTSQSHGEWDFDLILADGTEQPVEVTRSTDPVAERIYAAIRGRRGERFFVDRVRCQRDWLVTPEPEANIARLKKRIDAALSEVEGEGRTEVFTAIDYANSIAVQGIATLEVSAASVTTWNPPGRIGVTYPGFGGMVSAEALVDELEAEANKPDNRTKLGRSSAPVRHLVVVLDGLNRMGRYALVHDLLPARPLVLPLEITTVWAIAREWGTNRYVVWRATASAFERLGKFLWPRADGGARASAE